MRLGLGWVKTPRDVLDNPVVWKDPEHVAVWLYLYLSATHKEIPAIFGGSCIKLKPGQVITGRKAIAAHTGVNEHKVRRIIIAFENAQLIAQQKSNRGSLITLLNWMSEEKTAHQNAQQLHNNCTTDAQQLHTNKNKNIRNIKNTTHTIEDSGQGEPTLKEIRQYCEEKGLVIDPERFFNYYSSVSWKNSSGQKIDNWKFVAENWNHKETGERKENGYLGKDAGSTKDKYRDDFFDSV